MSKVVPLPSWLWTVDPALVLLDDAIDGGQAQAGAAVQFLGGEERLENPAQVLRRDAAAGVAEGQADVAARGRLGVLMRGGGIQGDGGGFDAEPAAAGHGVAGIDGQIEQDLLDHAQVGLDGGKAGGEIHLQGDVLAQDAAEHLGDVVDDFVQIHHLRMELLLAAEGEQLAGQRRRPACRLRQISLSESARPGGEFFPGHDAGWRGR